MINDEKLRQMTIEQQAEFLATQRFLGMGKEFVLQWLKSEAEKKAIENRPLRTVGGDLQTLTSNAYGQSCAGLPLS